MPEETKKRLTPRSFRIADDTFHQLKELSEEISGNQDEVFTQLIRVFQMEKGKEQFPERKKEISDFQNYTELLTKMFIHSLEDYATLEDKVLLTYEEKLDSKDKTILQLQKQIETLKKRADRSDTTSKELKDDNVSLAKELEHVRKTLTAERKRTEQSLDDKEILIQELKERKKAANQQIAALTMELSVARTKLDEVDNLNSTISSITKELEDAKKELKEAKQSINNLEKDAETVKASHKEELTSLKKQAEHDKKIQDSNHKMQLELLKNSMNADKQSALLELEKSHRKELEELKLNHAASIENLQTKYERLLEKLENTIGLSSKQ